MRTFARVIAATIRAMLRRMRALARAMFGLPPEADPDTDALEAAVEAADQPESQASQTDIMRAWIAASYSGEPEPDISDLEPHLQAWLRDLDRTEIARLALFASDESLERHAIDRTRIITCVRRTPTPAEHDAHMAEVISLAEVRAAREAEMEEQRLETLRILHELMDEPDHYRPSRSA